MILWLNEVIYFALMHIKIIMVLKRLNNKFRSYGNLLRKK